MPNILEIIMDPAPSQTGCRTRTQDEGCSENYAVQILSLEPSLPVMSNDAYSLQLSFSTISGVAESENFAATFGSSGFADTDADGNRDFQDNCSLVANSQFDADGDGFGNRCDADFNNDGIVNIVDLGLLRKFFFSNDPNYDLNQDGVVNVIDLGLIRQAFFGMPGPSGIPGQ